MLRKSSVQNLSISQLSESTTQMPLLVGVSFQAATLHILLRAGLPPHLPLQMHYLLFLSPWAKSLGCLRLINSDNKARHGNTIACPPIAICDTKRSVCIVRPKSTPLSGSSFCWYHIQNKFRVSFPQSNTTFPFPSPRLACMQLNFLFFALQCFGLHNQS